uniref:Uncharacterized protein n=2 Tax=Chrysotila carterae TaxID=13221 RepID=A0A7S4B4V3_CHRCT
MPYSPVARRYNGYSKYGSRIRNGITTYASLRKDIDEANWQGVKEALQKGSKGQGDAVKPVPPSELRSFARALGLVSNSLLQSENDSSTTAANLLARHLVNEAYFAMDDIEAAAAASDKAAAVAAWQAGAEYINAFIGLVNRNITPKVGDQFEFIVLG